METISVQTAQNVEIEYEIASVGDRILAYLLDLLILVALYILIFTVFSSLMISEATRNFAPFLLIILLPIFLYDLLCEVFMDGQSIGKKALKIKVVRLDGTQPTLGNYLIRWLLRLVDISLTYGSAAIITILVNQKGQRLGDLAAHTSVIKLVKRESLKDTIFTEVDENYEVLFPQAAMLDDRNIEVAKEVLNANVEEDRHGIVRNNLALKAQKIIEKKLGISSGMESRFFLRTIIKDYNSLNGRL